MTNTVAKAREQIVFCVEESTKGTAVFPTTAAQMVVSAGDADINQQPSFTNSEEIVDSLDVLDRIQDQTGAGTWSIPIYLRPSGTAGTAPMGGVLFKSLQGLETISPATSVTYAQAKEKPSFTIWMKKGHTVFFGTGACAESGKLSMSTTGGAKVDFSGGFMVRGWVGTDAVAGAVSADTEVIVDDAKKFIAGGYVQIGSDTNTDAGYKIVSVDYDTDTLTMADSITCDDGAVIKGFLPTFTPVGSVLENKDTTISFDGSTKALKSTDVTINSPVAWQTDEITSSGYVEEYVEDQRNITFSPSVLFRENDLSYFYNATQNVKTAVIISIANGAGKTCTINLPYVELEVPQVQSSSPTVSLTISGTALGDTGEDSATIVFT